MGCTCQAMREPRSAKPGLSRVYPSLVRRYRRLRHSVICWLRNWLFEIGVAQIVVGVGLWVAAPVLSPGEPPIILAMSALALIFSGWTTAGVAATDDG